MIPVLHGVWSAGGVVGDYEHIETVTVGSGGAASVTFSSIAGTYKHLQIRALSKQSASDFLLIRFNGDTSTSSYTTHALEANGTSAGSVNRVQLSSGVYPVYATANIFYAIVSDLLDYTSTSKNKTLRSLSGADNNGSGNLALASGLWMNSANAVTSITIIPSAGTLSQYSTFALYGVK